MRLDALARRGLSTHSFSTTVRAISVTSPSTCAARPRRCARWCKTRWRSSVAAPGDIAIVLADDALLPELNRRYQRQGSGDRRFSFEYVDPASGGAIHGDLAISLDRTRGGAALPRERRPASWRGSSARHAAPGRARPTPRAERRVDARRRAARPARGGPAIARLDRLAGIRRLSILWRCRSAKRDFPKPHRETSPTEHERPRAPKWPLRTPTNETGPR